MLVTDEAFGFKRSLLPPLATRRMGHPHCWERKGASPVRSWNSRSAVITTCEEGPLFRRKQEIAIKALLSPLRETEKWRRYDYDRRNQQDRNATFPGVHQQWQRKPCSGAHFT